MSMKPPARAGNIALAAGVRSPRAGHRPAEVERPFLHLTARLCRR